MRRISLILGVMLLSVCTPSEDSSDGIVHFLEVNVQNKTQKPLEIRKGGLLKNVDTDQQLTFQFQDKLLFRMGPSSVVQLVDFRSPKLHMEFLVHKGELNFKFLKTGTVEVRFCNVSYCEEFRSGSGSISGVTNRRL